MVQSTTRSQVRVSPSMVQSVYHELKANGYSDRQILALIAGLADVAKGHLFGEPEPVSLEAEVESGWGIGSPEMDLSLLGIPNSVELGWAERTD